MIRGFTSGQRK